jgi:hypothetical protein
MRVLMNMSGTGVMLVYCFCVSPAAFCCSSMLGRLCVVARRRGEGDILLMSVRTDETRFIKRALMLASSRCPKPGSTAPAVQPTVMFRQRCSILGDTLPLKCSYVCGMPHDVRGS